MKISIIYFSLSNRTKLLSELISSYLQSENLDAELFGLKTPATGSFLKNCVDAMSKKSIKLDNIPQIAGSEAVFLGSPVWAFDIAPAMRAFIRKTDLSGKKVFVFTTYGSGKGKQRALNSFVDLVRGKGGQVVGSGEIKGRKVNSDFPQFRENLEKCLKKYQLIKPQGH